MRITVDIPDEELTIVRENLERKMLTIELGMDIMQPEQKLAAKVLLAAEKGDQDGNSDSA